MDIEENFESQLWGFKIFRGSIGVCCLNLSFEIFFFFFQVNDHIYELGFVRNLISLMGLKMMQDSFI